MEQWKIIDGYNGRYSVSNEGRVRNNESNKLMGNYDKRCVCLSYQGTKKEYAIDKLCRQYWTPDFSGEWKVISGFGGRYSISNEGEARNNETLTCLKLSVDEKGRKHYCFTNNKNIRQISLSTLMREYWEYEWIKELRDGEEAKRCVFDGRYFITSHGRVWSNARQIGWMKNTKRDKYYYSVCIAGKHRLVHRLVGRHFLQDFDEKLDVCHIDENLPEDEINRADNLFMGNPRDNMFDSFRKGRSPHSIPIEEVKQIRKRHASGEKEIDLAREFGRSRSVVNHLLRGKTYQWVE